MRGWTTKIDWANVHERLSGLPKGQRGAYLDQVAAVVGKSRKTVYRVLQRRYGPAKAIERAPTVITGEDVQLIAEIKESYKTITLKGTSRELSTEDAISIADEEGYDRARLLRPSTVNAALRRARYRQPARRVRVEASYACQQYQIDFSRSKHFQIIDDLGQGDWLLRVSAKELHYKAGSERLRAWVAAVMDEYSRLRLVRYYAATGEDRYMGLALLHFLFSRPEDDHLMRHVPERLKSDQGAFLKSAEARAACEALEIDPKFAEPGNKESQGKIERQFRTLWQKVEARLATSLVRQQGEKATITLSDLSVRVHAYTVREHDLPHPTRHGATRGALYQQSVLQRRPPVLEGDLRDYAFRTWERRADAAAMISVENALLQVPDHAIGKWVRVYRTMHGEWAGSLIDGFSAEPFAITPFRFTEVDDFSARPHRTFEQEMAMAARETIQGATRRLTPRAEPAPASSPVLEARAGGAEPQRLSKLDALAEVGRLLSDAGLNPTDYVNDVAPYVHEGMTRADLDAVLLRLFTATRKAM